jgi:hypothetical protein
VAVKTGETVRVVRHNLYRGLEKLRKAFFGDPCSGDVTSQGETR